MARNKTVVKKNSLIIPEEVIMNKIYLIRENKVMVDRDLAKLYNVETKRLKEAVKRNLSRFPEDFMFEMTKDEFENWRSQFATSNSEKMAMRRLPFCFTEQGVTMLSCILNSERAVFVNIFVIRVFTKLRKTALTQKEILLSLQKVEKKIGEHDTELKLLFSALKQLLTPVQVKRRKIGCRLNSDDIEQYPESRRINKTLRDNFC
jgi:hypothetical protein